MKYKLLYLALFYPAVIYAEDTFTTNLVVISSNTYEEDLIYTPQSINVKSGKEIQNNALQTIPDALKDVPGVNLVNDGTPAIKRISIRGEDPSRTVLLVDGIRLNDLKNKSGTPLLLIPSNIERVEVLKGPASLLYGSDAIGGVVNIISKKPSSDKMKWDLGTSYNGSYEAFSQNASVSGTVDKFTYIISGFNTNTDDLYINDHQRVDNTDFNSQGANADLAYSFSDKFKLGFKLDYFNLDANTASTKTGEDFIAHIPEWEQSIYKIYLDFNKLNNYLENLKIDFWYQDGNKDFNSVVSKIGPKVSVTNDQYSLGTSVKSKIAITDALNVKLGADYSYSTIDSYSNFKMNINGQELSGFINDLGYEQENTSLYSILNYNLLDNLILNFGLRYDYINIGNGTSYQKLMSPVEQITKSADKSYDSLISSLGLVYTVLDDNGAIRFNYSQGFRAPNIQELYLTTMTHNMQLGSKDLKEETSDNFEIGFRYDNQENLFLDFDIFYTISDNYIDTQKISNVMGGVWQYSNISKATSYGAELSVDYRIFNNIILNQSLSAIKRKYEINEASTYDTGLPLFSGTSGIKYVDSTSYFDYYGNFYLRYASDTTLKDLNGTNQSSVGDSQWGGYTTFNLKFGFDFGKEKDMSLDFGVENILDKRYQTSDLIHEPGRFFFASFNASI